MYQKIKEEMKEIISIVNDCPENLREKCFEVMLNHLLSVVTPLKPEISYQELNKSEYKETNKNQEVISENESESDLEIVLKDFHIKVRKFLQSNGITCEDINNLYYKSDNKILPLYEDLNTNKMAESQIRIALLTAFESSNNNDGDMITDVETVRVRCQELKCYDSANYAAIFNKNASLFDGFEKYEKGRVLKLSGDGKKELAKVILELSRGV